MPHQDGPKKFIPQEEAKTRKQAERLAPWAAVIIKADGGWRAYKFITDAEIAKRQR